jgi:hypothetical protein
VLGVLKKFIWQTKRKMNGLTITNHLMAVLIGAQGKGKTTFVEALIAPLADLKVNTDFKAIDDERNIDLWTNYIMFFDEMGYATRTDVDTLKNKITCATLTRRPMRSNALEVVRQNATFIGCSNKELSQLIFDPTGVRRFAPLRFSDTPDWSFINSTDFSALWQSVELNAVDPCDAIMTELREIQEGARAKGKLESWIEHFDWRAAPDNRMTIPELHTMHVEWASKHLGGRGLLLDDFRTELNKIIREGQVELPFQKKTTNAGVRYVPAADNDDPRVVSMMLRATSR